jgi:hypothetical protein
MSVAAVAAVPAVAASRKLRREDIRGPFFIGAPRSLDLIQASGREGAVISIGALPAPRYMRSEDSDEGQQ